MKTTRPTLPTAMAMTDNKWRTTTANNVAKREARQCCGCAAAIDRTAIDTLQCVTADCSALTVHEAAKTGRQSQGTVVSRSAAYMYPLQCIDALVSRADSAAFGTYLAFDVTNEAPLSQILHAHAASHRMHREIQCASDPKRRIGFSAV